jgi:hypothetical protein
LSPLDSAAFDITIQELDDDELDALSRSSSVHQLLKDARKIKSCPLLCCSAHSCLLAGGGSMTMLEYLDRERIRRTSSIMRANRSKTVGATSQIASRRDLNNLRRGSTEVELVAYRLISFVGFIILYHNHLVVFYRELFKCAA